MNKERLAKAIASKLGKPYGSGLEFVHIFIYIVSRALKQRERVLIKGFGSFSTYRRRAHNGHNPQNGKKLLIPSKRVVKFTAGNELFALINLAKK